MGSTIGRRSFTNFTASGAESFMKYIARLMPLVPARCAREAVNHDVLPLLQRLLNEPEEWLVELSHAVVAVHVPALHQCAMGKRR